MVQWNETCIVRYREIPYNQHDVEQAWYTEDDISSFKEERRQIKKLVRRFSTLELFERTMGDLHSCRGLEKYISRSKMVQRKERIQTAFDVVCLAQADKRLMESPNAHERIAKEYRKVTERCQKEAVARALVYLAWNNQRDVSELTQPFDFGMDQTPTSSTKGDKKNPPERKLVSKTAEGNRLVLLSFLKLPSTPAKQRF